MPRGAARDMLVLLDGNPNSEAGLRIAQRYARGTVALTGWEAEPPPGDVEVVASASAEPTVSEALRAAAQRHIAFVAIRRDLAPPERLLQDLLVATADHAGDDVPGFAVFLVEDDPRPFSRILSIVDRRHGAISGLATYVGVAVADTSGAHIDILVIGDDAEVGHSEDEEDLLAINRETELFERARTRAKDAGLSVDWLPAGAVADAWRVITDQLSQHDYDLVIHDLGEVSLGRRGRAEQAMVAATAPGGPGEVPLRLLTEVDLPILLVIDEIRLGMAPLTLLKAGAVAAVSLGIVSSPALSAGDAGSSPTIASESLQEANDLIAGLEEALGVPEEERQSEAASASRGAQPTGARAQAEATAATGAGATAATTAKAKATTPAAKPAAKPTAPKGGATPADVAKATKQLASIKSTFATDRAAQKKAQMSLDKAKGALDKAEAEAQRALATINAAQESQAQAQAQADTTRSSASGVLGLLPGSPTQADLTAAEDEARRAQEQLEEALAAGETALETLTAAEEKVLGATETLSTARERTAASRTAHEAASEKVKVYKASLAKSRQPPVHAGQYRLTARYGQAGGHWASGYHTGLDFAGSSGTRIGAAASGTVVEAGYQGAYGNRVVIQHSNGYQTTYNHMSKISVKVGQKVQTGDKVGNLGSTGNSTGPHLHFEVMRNGKFMDPESWLGW